MSFSGFYQCICENGHWTDNDCYIFTPEYDPCRVCRATMVWYNLVDTTNGSFNVNSDGNETDERIDGYIELEEKTPPHIETCNLGHKHCTVEATYKIPEDKGHRIQGEVMTDALSPELFEALLKDE